MKDTNCAGMPLDSSGRKVLKEGGPKLDLDAEYRSMMGAGADLIKNGFSEENLIYPETGAIWPLRPGAPSGDGQ